MTTTRTPTLYAVCQSCDAVHEATYSHEGQWGEGPIFAVVCTVDWLTDYYTVEGLTSDSQQLLHDSQKG